MNGGLGHSAIAKDKAPSKKTMKNILTTHLQSLKRDWMHSMKICRYNILLCFLSYFPLGIKIVLLFVCGHGTAIHLINRLIFIHLVIICQLFSPFEWFFNVFHTKNCSSVVLALKTSADKYGEMVIRHQ